MDKNKMQTKKEYMHGDLVNLFTDYSRKKHPNSNYGTAYHQMILHNNLNILSMLDEMAKKDGKRAVLVNHWKKENPTMSFMFLNHIDELDEVYVVKAVCTRYYSNDVFEKFVFYNDIHCEIGENPEYENTEISVSYLGEFYLKKEIDQDNNKTEKDVKSSSTKEDVPTKPASIFDVNPKTVEHWRQTIETSDETSKEELNAFMEDVCKEIRQGKEDCKKYVLVRHERQKFVQYAYETLLKMGYNEDLDHIYYLGGNNSPYPLKGVVNSNWLEKDIKRSGYGCCIKLC